MRRLLAAAFVAAVFSSAPVHAGFLGGVELHGHCTAPSISEQYICASYIMGVIDATQHLLGKGAPGRACIPDGASAQTAVEAIIGYIKAGENRRDSPAEILVGHALRMLYPCKG